MPLKHRDKLLNAEGQKKKKEKLINLRWVERITLYWP